MFDAAKLKLYYDFLLNTMKDEGEIPELQAVVGQVVEQFIKPLKLKKTAKILDVGCGVGYFMDEMKSMGYKDLTGVSWTEGDIEACKKKKHNIIRGDINFIKDDDNKYDLIFCRHSLEHSVFPMIALMEYNRLLKKGGLLYVEMPAPMNARQYENWDTHYSVMNEVMLQSLIMRAGFDIEWYRNASVPITHNETGRTTQDTYNCVLAKKKATLAVK
jgi:ubiquinone/menaquinone biosynthesis C-methylase UbiE